MVKLNAPVWETLDFSSRGAEKWLQALLEEEGDPRKNIEVLADNLTHQLNWYSATAYVLPHLAALCPKLSKADQVFLIAHMGAAIAAEAEYPLLPDTEAYNEFQEGLEGLRQITKPFIVDPEVHALLKTDVEFGMLFSLGAMAIIGDRKHAYNLWYLSGFTWEEGSAACICGWNDETISLVEPPKHIEPIKISTWDKKSLDNEAVWLNGLLKLVGDDMICPVLPLVYGIGICPDCGEREPYWNWLNRFQEEC